MWLADEPHRITSAREQPPGWLVALEGIDERDAAHALIGREVSVERVALPEGEHYLADLVGFSVRTTVGEAIGTFEGEVRGLPQTTFLVRRSDGRESLVPAMFLTSIDAERRELVVDPPDGLLD